MNKEKRKKGGLANVLSFLSMINAFCRFFFPRRGRKKKRVMVYLSPWIVSEEGRMDNPGGKGPEPV